MTRKGWIREAKIRRPTYRGRYDIAKVLELRNAGHGYKIIAAELGVSRDMARELVMRFERLVAHREELADAGDELPPLHEPRPISIDEDGPDV